MTIRRCNAVARDDVEVVYENYCGLAKLEEITSWLRRLLGINQKDLINGWKLLGPEIHIFTEI